MAKVKVTVVSKEGHCSAHHKLGDVATFDWDTHEIEGRICLHALYSMMPKIYALAHEGNVAFATNEEGALAARHACPDGHNPVIFELELV